MDSRAQGEIVDVKGMVVETKNRRNVRTIALTDLCVAVRRDWKREEAKSSRREDS